MKTYKFGDYVKVEMHRHEGRNEMYKAKVIGELTSNHYVNVPIHGNPTQRNHDQSERVIRIVICGVSETSVIKVRVKDVEADWMTLPSEELLRETYKQLTTEKIGVSAEQCLKNELNTERLTPIQWDGILRAMENYKNK